MSGGPAAAASRAARVSVDSARCDQPTAAASLILAEGQFGAHSAKTAYGRHPLRARRRRGGPRLDHAPGRTWRAACRATTSRSSRRSSRGPGAADPAGRPADRHRADRRPAARRLARPIIRRRDRGRPGRPVRPPHVPRRRPGVRGRGCGGRGVTIVDYRRPPERMETAVGRRHAPGKRVILTVGDRLRDRQDVGRPRAAPGRPSRRATGRPSCRPARPG